MAKIRRTKKVRVINCTCDSSRKVADGKSKLNVFAGTDCVCRVIKKKPTRDIPATTVTIVSKKG